MLDASAAQIRKFSGRERATVAYGAISSGSASKHIMKRQPVLNGGCVRAYAAEAASKVLELSDHLILSGFL